ncbi:hypothetical protein TUZN_0351 [Thermoproteus uzoniensis 768-20]|uniref:tRNA(Phe) 7-((3-amino-3-carboxypropyl)-4-demethylwyosine(37)-N(4))-methyltransferase n=1 Tax=Thermoproteus uzoniensis (strain 768-20) TaxID=999630 RepID=F2L2R0_THEU7|nr:hypothetical protein TUZN_0351 [Thermoproteus uzoniensis 768-20]
MIVDAAAFANRKRAFVERLEREAAQRRVDQDIYPLLKRLNELPWLYTTSSCSGRILLASVKTPSYSKGRGFMPIAKWHRAVSVDEVRAAVEPHDDVWMLVRGGILHVAVDSARRAYELVSIGHRTGHKHSGIIAINRAGIIIEILGEERLDIPLKSGGRLVADLEEAVAMANRVLLLAKARLAFFAGVIEARYLGGSSVDEEAVKSALRSLSSCLWRSV